MEAKDLLIADLDHFGESMLRNEEVGEKRFEFFITLVTAVGGGLAALAASDSRTAQTLFSATAVPALAGLLVVGILTYLRMLQRNRVRDEYQRTLKYIRNLYRSACGETCLASYSVPRRCHGPSPLPKAGYAETIGILNGFLLGSWLLLVLQDARTAGAVAAVTGGLLWLLARKRDASLLPAQYFRAGVGAVIMNPEGHALALERAEPAGAWQLPQGGIEDGEDAEGAIYRELAEETGIAAGLQLVARLPEVLAYVLPPEHRSTKTGMGQVGIWFLFRYVGDSSAVELPQGGEFRDWSWRPLGSVVASAAAFRKPAYERLLLLVEQCRASIASEEP